MLTFFLHDASTILAQCSLVWWFFNFNKLKTWFVVESFRLPLPVCPYSLAPIVKVLCPSVG